MAFTHDHAAEVGTHVTNDGKEFGENSHLIAGEHTHEDVFSFRNPATDQDELWSFDPTADVTAEEAEEIDAALDAVPDETTKEKPVNTSPVVNNSVVLQEKGTVVDQK
jgi:hypothetical protein